MVVQSLVGGRLKFHVSGVAILMYGDEIRDLSVDFPPEELRQSESLGKLVSRGYLKILQLQSVSDRPLPVIVVLPEPIVEEPEKMESVVVLTPLKLESIILIEKDIVVNYQLVRE